MDLASERDRLVTAAAERVDALRRRFAIPYAISVCGIAIVPLVPGAHRFAGSMQVWQGLLLGGYCALGILAATFAYHRYGPKSRAYHVMECFEVLGLTGLAPGYAYASDLPSPMFWLVYALGPVFWSQIKPKLWRRYNAIALAACVITAVLYFAEDKPGMAVVALCVGLAAAALGVSVARSQLRTFDIEAERNVAEAALAEVRRKQERRKIERSLELALQDDLFTLARDLAKNQETLEEAMLARNVAAALDRMWSDESSCTAKVLGERIAEKARALSTTIAFRASVASSDVLDAPTVTALLRIAQELVRNAVTHSGGGSIEVELRDDATATRLFVRDDGGGLDASTLSQSQGGLRNASRRLAELGGTLTLSSAKRGTELEAHIPKR